jgi:hypothetical protein
MFSVAVADVNGDGFPDLVTDGRTYYHNDDYEVSVLLGNGGGGFQEPTAVIAAEGVAVADVNGDGFADLLVTDAPDGALVSVLLGGAGSFQRLTADQAVGFRDTPYRGDLDHDGVPDVVVLDSSGAILYRRGLPGDTIQFAPPVVLNPGDPARDITLLRTAAGLAVAASDRSGDTVSLYTFTGTTFARTAVARTGNLPLRVAAADLTGDGLDDLIVTNLLDDTITLAVQQPDGSFGDFRTVSVGAAPSDIAFADLDGQDGLDVIISNRSSGDVTVLYNDPAHLFGRAARYRAGTGPSGLQYADGSVQPAAREEPVSVVAGPFLGSGGTDLVVVNRGAHAFGTLPGTPGGGFANPAEAYRFSTSDGSKVNDLPGEAVAADFDADGRLDLAVLMEDRGEVWVYRGHGDGTFTLMATVPAGNAPTGLAADDVNGDGQPDLMVGNGFGDILFILGNGDGTFRPFVRTDQRVPFVAVAGADGVTHVYLADQAHDRAAELLRQPGTRTFSPGAFQRDGSDGLIGPGAVALADLDGKNGRDLIFANSGSNNILVYLRRADGSFADEPLSFFAGTSPAALTVADLNGDGRPDLVVGNQGSNDVSVLLGSRDGLGNWTFKYGPRLKSGGLGVNAVAALDANADGVPDILATNGQSGSVSLIPGIGSNGVGTGLFDDPGLTTTPVAVAPLRQTQVVSPTVAFALTQQGTLLQFNPTTGAVLDIATAGPVSAFRAVTATELFTANGDDSLSLLTTDDGQHFAQRAALTDPRLGDLSALEVLQPVAGLFDLYLTSAGESQPILLTLDLRAELAPVGGPLTLAVTLLTGFEGESPAVPVPDQAAEVFGPALFVSQAAVLDAAGFGGEAAGGQTTLVPPGEALLAALDLRPTGDGTEEGREAEPESPPKLEPGLQQFISGLAEALERLDRAEGSGRVPAGTGAPDRAEAPTWQTWLSRMSRFVDRLAREVVRPPSSDARNVSGPEGADTAAPEPAGPAHEAAIDPAVVPPDGAGATAEGPLAPVPQHGTGRQMIWAAALVGAMIAAGGFLWRTRKQSRE